LANIIHFKSSVLSKGFYLDKKMKTLWRKKGKKQQYKYKAKNLRGTWTAEDVTAFALPGGEQRPRQASNSKMGRIENRRLCVSSATGKNRFFSEIQKKIPNALIFFDVRCPSKLALPLPYHIFPLQFCLSNCHSRTCQCILCSDPQASPALFCLLVT